MIWNIRAFAVISICCYLGTALAFIVHPTRRVQAWSDHALKQSVGESLVEGELSTKGESLLDTLEPGTPDGYYIVDKFKFLSFNLTAFDETTIQRLKLTPHNVTVPIALMLWKPSHYSISKARKACRKGNILVLSDTWFRGRVGHRVLTDMTIAEQVRLSVQGYVVHGDQPFELPVVYQDDDMAIVNKPAGIASRERGGVRAALSFVLSPPNSGTFGAMRRPQPVHRLDKATSGLLLIAKTKPSMVHLSRQFLNREIKKTYTAIVNGIPSQKRCTTISAQQAIEMGVDVPDDDSMWNLLHYTLEEKEAITVWRVLGYYKSLKAQCSTVTMVELKPKTGRYHQLRRHMAWACQAPIVGDATYDLENPFPNRGLMLCSNKIRLQHPSQPRGGQRDSHDERMLEASIPLPTKFHNFVGREQERSLKFEGL